MGAVGAGGQSAARDEFCSFSLIRLAVERRSIRSATKKIKIDDDNAMTDQIIKRSCGSGAGGGGSGNGSKYY